MREQSLLLETWNNPQSIKHSVMLSWNPMAVWSTSLLLFFFFSTDRRNLFDLNTCHSVYKSYLRVNTLVSHLNTMQFLVHEINKSINYSIGRNKNPLPFYKSFYIFTIVRKAGYIDQSGSTVTLQISSPTRFRGNPQRWESFIDKWSRTP